MDREHDDTDDVTQAMELSSEVLGDPDEVNAAEYSTAVGGSSQGLTTRLAHYGRVLLTGRGPTGAQYSRQDQATVMLGLVCSLLVAVAALELVVGSFGITSGPLWTLTSWVHLFRQELFTTVVGIATALTSSAELLLAASLIAVLVVARTLDRW